MTSGDGQRLRNLFGMIHCNGPRCCSSLSSPQPGVPPPQHRAIVGYRIPGVVQPLYAPAAQGYGDRSCGFPDASVRLSVPDEFWPAVPLNRMNCVDHPAESARCAKNLSSEVEGSISFDGEVVVIFNSPFSLTRNLNATIATSAVEVTRSTPEKLSGSEKIWARKRATWSDGGSASVAGGTASDPSRRVTSSVTVLDVAAVLVMASPLRIEPACPGVPDAST